MPNADLDFKDIYYPLKELLEDMCNFTYHEQITNMSEKDRKMAESIIMRSREQLKALAKFKPLVETSEEYVIMNKDENTTQAGHPTLPEDISNTSQSARDVDKDEKCGYIYMKRRFLLNFGKMYRVYAVINMKYFLIYNSENDSKPIHMINLLSHHIRYNCERTNYFTLIGSDSKTYQFQAPNQEEMESWVTKLNKCHMRKKRRNKVNANTIRPVHDFVKTDASLMRTSLQQNGENIYEDIYKARAPEIKNSERVQAEKEQVPPLPTRTILGSRQTPAVYGRSSDQHLDKLNTLDINQQNHNSGHSSCNLRLADEEDMYEEVEYIRRTEKEPGQYSGEKLVSGILETTVPPVHTLKGRVAEKPPISKKPTNLSTLRRIKLK